MKKKPWATPIKNLKTIEVIVKSSLSVKKGKKARPIDEIPTRNKPITNIVTLFYFLF